MADRRRDSTRQAPIQSRWRIWRVGQQGRCRLGRWVALKARIRRLTGRSPRLEARIQSWRRRSRQAPRREALGLPCQPRREWSGLARGLLGPMGKRSMWTRPVVARPVVRRGLSMTVRSRRWSSTQLWPGRPMPARPGQHRRSEWHSLRGSKRRPLPGWERRPQLNRQRGPAGSPYCFLHLRR
jgi:hypothetical protein